MSIAAGHHGAPTATPSTPTQQPTARATEFTSLFTQTDDFSLGVPQRYGPLTTALATLPPGITIDIDAQVTPPPLPTHLPVWRFEATPLDPRAVAARFGLPAGARSQAAGDATVWPDAGLRVDPHTDSVSWLSPSGSGNPRLPDTPFDADQAVSAAAAWLQRAGLPQPAHAAASVEVTNSGDNAAHLEWRVTWRRTAPSDPQRPLDQTVARVSSLGALEELELSHPRVAGGSLYRLRPWQDALQEAEQGRWFQVCCQPLPDYVNPATLHVIITGVSIRYAVAETPQGLFAIPMYAFSETGAQQPGLVPALAP